MVLNPFILVILLFNNLVFSCIFRFILFVLGHVCIHWSRRTTLIWFDFVRWWSYSEVCRYFGLLLMEFWQFSQSAVLWRGQFGFVLKKFWQLVNAKCMVERLVRTGTNLQCCGFGFIVLTASQCRFCVENVQKCSQVNCGCLAVGWVVFWQYFECNHVL